MKNSTRNKILKIVEECSDDIQDEIKNAIDDIEMKFVEIRDLLDKIDIHNLDNIEDAFKVADDMADELY